MSKLSSNKPSKSSSNKPTESKVLCLQKVSPQCLLQAVDKKRSKRQKGESKAMSYLGTIPAGAGALIAQFLSVNERLYCFGVACKHLRGIALTRAAWPDSLELALPLPVLQRLAKFVRPKQLVLHMPGVYDKAVDSRVVGAVVQMATLVKADLSPNWHSHHITLMDFALLVQLPALTDLRCTVKGEAEQEIELKTPGPLANLRLNVPDSTGVSHILSQLPQLTNLSYDWGRDDISADSLEGLQNLRSLKIVQEPNTPVVDPDPDLWRDWLEPLLEMKQLQSLSCAMHTSSSDGECEWISVQWLLKRLKNCSNLQSLRFSGQLIYQAQDLEPMRGMPLTELTLLQDYREWSWTVDNLDVVSTLPLLKSLSLECIDCDVFKPLATACNLTSLELKHIWLRGDDFRHLVNSPLQTLIIRHPGEGLLDEDDDETPDPGFKHLRRCPLTTLKLHRGLPVDFTRMRHLAAIKTLTALRVTIGADFCEESGSDDETAASESKGNAVAAPSDVCGVLASMKQLQRVNLDGDGWKSADKLRRRLSKHRKMDMGSV